MLALVGLQGHPQVSLMTSFFFIRIVYRRSKFAEDSERGPCGASVPEGLLTPKLLANRYLRSFATTSFISTIWT